MLSPYRFILVSEDPVLCDLLMPVFLHRGTPLSIRRRVPSRIPEGTVILWDRDTAQPVPKPGVPLILFSSGERAPEEDCLLAVRRPFDLSMVYDRIRDALDTGDAPDAPAKSGTEDRPAPDVEFVRAGRTLRYGSASVPLTRSECALIQILLHAAGGFVSVSDLSAALRSDKPNTVSAHLSHIRKKTEAAFGFSVIRSGRNTGYALRHVRT